MRLPGLHVAFALVALAATSCDAWRAANESQSHGNSTTVGTEPYAVGVGCSSATPYPTPEGPRFTRVIENPLADFISLHFTTFNLPPNDYLLIRATHDAKTFIKMYGSEPFRAFSESLPTKSVTIELVTTGDPTGNNVFQCPEFAVDKYHYKAVPSPGQDNSKQEAVCGPDDTQEAACFRGSPVAFQRSDAVARLLIHKGDSSFFCTGWLVGCEGHLLTNHHCISTQDHASNTEYEFRAQGDTCATACNTPQGCKGTVRARSAQLVLANAALDYALVKLDINFSNDYGYLQLRESGALLGERIYVPQHPGGWGKRIAMKVDQDWGTVESTTMGGCALNQVAYSLDTQGGSSGSPVIAWSDNAVVGLHHCGGCPNTAINTNQLIADMRTRNILPKCAVFGATPVANPPPPPTTTTLPPPATNRPTTAPPPTTTAPPPTLAPPSPPTTSPTKPRRSTVRDGTISTTATVASIDYVDFVLAEDAIVELDILSMETTRKEYASDAIFVDVNNDCNAGYIDSSLVLFRMNADGSVSEASTLAVNDDAPAGYGTADGSISSADSYIVQQLPAGRYRVAIGVSSMTVPQAVAKSMPLATTPRVCDSRLSNYGSYRLTLSTSSDVAVSGPNSYIGSQCAGDYTARPYSKCAYHREAPLTKTTAIDGTVVRQPGSVTVDHIPFTVPTFGRVTMDLSSFESEDGTTYLDVNGFCSSSYIDAVAYVFRRSAPGAALTVADVVNAVDDDENFALRRKQRVGVSFRDPFVSLPLPAGDYVLAVGRYPMTVQAAIAKRNTASPDGMTPLSCGVKAPQGNYRVTLASASELAAVAPNSFTGGKCPSNVGKQLCK